MMPSTSVSSDVSADESDDGDDNLTVLTFDLADDRYCVRVDAVATVHGITETTQLEAADDPWNAGSVTVSGSRVRIVDLPRIVTASRPTSERVATPRLLVLTPDDDTDGVRYGWLVDSVDVTRTARADTLEPTNAPTRFVAGRFEFDDGGAILLDERAIHE